MIDGAAVRVPLVCFSQSDDELTPERRLNGETADDIYTDLTARRGGAGVDLTKARRLARNAGVAFMGDTKGGPFDVPGDLMPSSRLISFTDLPRARPTSASRSAVMICSGVGRFLPTLTSSLKSFRPGRS